MQTLGRIKLQKRAVHQSSDAKGRLDWLAQFCRLTPLDLELLRVVAGIRAPSAPDPDGWPVDALAAHLAHDERSVVDALRPGAALMSWGLVRVDTRVGLNERIARFLFGD